MSSAWSENGFLWLDMISKCLVSPCLYILLNMKIAIVDSGLGLVYMVRKLKEFALKHEYHLIFTSFCPIGNASSSMLVKEGQRIFSEIISGGYDIAFICCNTLSFYLPNDSRLVKIASLNREYLRSHRDVLPIGTKQTIMNIGYGYADVDLATHIEEDNFERIIEDISSWPFAPKYLLCCTHYSLVRKLIKAEYQESEVIDLIDDFIQIVRGFSEGEKETWDYGKRSETIRKYLMF